MTPPEVDPPPPRQPWEEPPPGGWVSHLGGLGLETLALAAVFLAAIGAWRLSVLARQMGAAPLQQQPGWAWIALVWIGACLLVAAMVVLVWRRLGGFALVGAMLTDHGRVARYGGRPPIWLDQPPPDGVAVVHLSDLHITEGDRVRMAERPVRGGNQVLGSLLARPEMKQADVIVITGDVTDRGTAASWQRALELLTAAGLIDRVVLVPGNHDLALVDRWSGFRDPGGGWLRNDRFGVVQLANLYKFFEAFAATAGGRLGSVLRPEERATEAMPFARAWADVQRAVHPFLHALPNMPVPRLAWGKGYRARRQQLRAYGVRIANVRRQLLALFPVAVPLADKDAVLFVLNSCTPVSRHPATNGLGRVGRAQYRRLDRLARCFSQPLRLVALHHHVVRRAEEQSHKLFARIVAKFTVLGDAPPLVRFCRKHDVRAVMNGHRHLSYDLRLPSGTVLLAAASSTLGDQLAHDPRPRFECYQVARQPAPPTVGIHREVVRLGALTAQP